MRAYETERGHGDLPPRRSTSTASSSRPSSTTCRSRTRARSCATATHERGRAATACRPATSGRSPSAAPADGPQPARRAGRGGDRRLAVGRLPRRRGEGARRAREGLELAADRRRLADPAREGLGPVPQQRAREDREPQGRLRGGDPARRARLRVRGHRREHLRRARRGDPHAAADGRDPRRHQPRVGDPDRRATRASRSSSATSRAPSCTSPTRSS